MKVSLNSQLAFFFPSSFFLIITLSLLFHDFYPIYNFLNTHFVSYADEYLVYFSINIIYKGISLNVFFAVPSLTINCHFLNFSKEN